MSSRKGIPNKRTVALAIRAKELGVDPFEILLLFAKGDWKALGYEAECYFSEKPDGAVKMGYVISPEMRVVAAKEAAKYLYPHRKSIEHKSDEPLNGMSPLQKLEALRQAVLLLESQVKSAS